MSNNPFTEIEEKLANIESLILAMSPGKQIQAGIKTEKPLTQAEACEFLGKSRASLINWRKKGLIQAYRINGRIFYKASELLACMQKVA